MIFPLLFFKKTMQVTTYKRKPLYMAFFIYINRTLKRQIINVIIWI